MDSSITQQLKNTWRCPTSEMNVHCDTCHFELNKLCLYRICVTYSHKTIVFRVINMNWTRSTYDIYGCSKRHHYKSLWLHSENIFLLVLEEHFGKLKGAVIFVQEVWNHHHLVNISIEHRFCCIGTWQEDCECHANCREEKERKKERD